MTSLSVKDLVERKGEALQLEVLTGEVASLSSSLMIFFSFDLVSFNLLPLF